MNLKNLALISVGLNFNKLHLVRMQYF